MARRRRDARDDDEQEGVAGQVASGFFGRAKGMVSGLFGGALKGGLFWGSIIFIAQATGLAGPIAKMIGGDELAAKVANWGKTADGVDNVGQRILISAGLGAAMGGAGGAAKGLLTPSGGAIGDVIGLGMALVTAAVVVGTAVNHNETGGAPRAGAPVPARPPAPPAARPGAH